MTERIHLTCQCGATLDVSSGSISGIGLQQRAFDESHQVCRDRGPQPCSVGRPRFRIVPAPPERSTPLPDPVVPSQ